MKKSILLILLLLLSTSASAANILGIYGDNGWLYANTTGKAGTFICLEDGTNCPAALNASGTVTSITATGPYLTGGTITTTGTIAVNTSAFCLATGANCVATGGGTGNVTGGGAAGFLAQWYNATQVNSLSFNILYGNVSNNLGNWSLDRPNYVNLTALDNATIARTGTCIAVDNTTHISVTQNTTTGGVQCVIVAKNPGAGGSGGSGMTVLYVNISSGNQTVLGNASILSFTNNAYVTWGMPNSGNLTATTSLAAFTTDNLAEGSNNLYYTFARWLTSLSSSGIGNWSLDKVNYLTSTQTYAAINTLSNWTVDRPNYVNFTILNAQNNLSLAQIVANIGNWTQDKSTYLQNSTHANFTKIFSDGNPNPISSNVSCWNVTGATSQWLVC